MRIVASVEVNDDEDNQQPKYEGRTNKKTGHPLSESKGNMNEPLKDFISRRHENLGMSNGKKCYF